VQLLLALALQMLVVTLDHSILIIAYYKQALSDSSKRDNLRSVAAAAGYCISMYSIYIYRTYGSKCSSLRLVASLDSWCVG
jgi:hypothetical protein